MFNKYLLLVLASVSLAFAQPVVICNDNQVIVKGKSYVCNLLAAKNYNFNFKDTQSEMSIFSAIVWYHGRNENQAEHFYKDQSETDWKVFDIKEKATPDGREVVLQSKNNEFTLTRTLRAFNEMDALLLKYELSAQESRIYENVSFPIMRMVRLVDSVSYNLNGSETEFVTEPMPKADKLARAHLLFFHSSVLKKTIILIPNLNAPLEKGEPSGLSVSFSDAKWCKNLSFSHLYLPYINYMKAGDKQVFETAMAVADGAELTDEMKRQAVAIAARLNFKAPRFKMRGICEDQTQPSSMAGMLWKGDGVALWQEISAKRVHPETALPAAALSEIRISAARNESESVQLAFQCDEGTVIDNIEASELTCAGMPSIPANNVQLEFLEYQEQHNGFTSQGMSTMVGDKLLPLEFPCAIKTGNQVVWLTVSCTKSQPAGLYKGTITINWHNSKAGKATLPLLLNVWNFELPDTPAYTAYGLLWETPMEMRRATMELARKYRHTTTVFRSDSNKMLRNIKDGRIVDKSEFELAKFAVDSLNYRLICVPAFMGAWNWRPGQNVRFGNMDINAPDFEEKFRGYLATLHSQAKELGYEKRIFVYMWDEVSQPMYEAVSKTTRICREASPDIRILTVGAPDEKVIENSDIIVVTDSPRWWGPIAKERIEKGRQAGKEFWVYVNGAFSPTYPLMSMRILTWRDWGMGVNGYLYWTMDYLWKGNFSDHGLNWKFYPPVKKGVPVASVRLAVMRDGIDDFDYLALAKKKLSQTQWAQLEKVISPLVNPDAKPNLDPVALVKAREAIGELLHNASAK